VMKSISWFHKGKEEKIALGGNGKPAGSQHPPLIPDIYTMSIHGIFPYTQDANAQKKSIYCQHHLDSLKNP